MKKTKAVLIFWGVLFCLLGLSARRCEQFTLSPPATAKLAEYAGSPLAQQLTKDNTAEEGAQKTITIPLWVSWSLISIGGVLLLESIVTEK
jgi:hypothetical protein